MPFEMKFFFCLKSPNSSREPIKKFLHFKMLTLQNVKFRVQQRSHWYKYSMQKKNQPDAICIPLVHFIYVAVYSYKVFTYIPKKNNIHLYVHVLHDILPWYKKLTLIIPPGNEMNSYLSNNIWRMVIFLLQCVTGISL